ncbi:MAG: hypothetical protein H7836_17475, partial [Magnetococcus sp. YQC-3]
NETGLLRLLANNPEPFRKLFFGHIPFKKKFIKELKQIEDYMNYIGECDFWMFNIENFTLHSL